MASFPWEKGVLLIALDAVQLSTGLAWKGTLKSDVTGSLPYDAATLAKGVQERGTVRTPDILDAHKIEELLRDLSTRYEYEQVWVAVEFPHWNAGASPVVRAAAHSYIRLVKRVWPKAKVVKVDPNTWQGSFKFKDRPTGQTTKEFSVYLAQQVYGWDCEDQDDRADAALILEWLRVNPIRDPPKHKKRTAKPKAAKKTP